MYIHEKTIKIVLKEDDNYFSSANKKPLSQILLTRPLGSSQNAINNMLKHEDEMKELMPNILGIGATDSKFKEHVTNYWNSLSIRIQAPYEVLNISMRFDILNPKYKANIDALKLQFEKDATQASKEKTIAAYVFGMTKGVYNVAPEDRHKYGVIEDIPSYLVWQYCLNHNVVANEQKDANKSVKIRFYLLDSDVEKETARISHALKMKANKLYFSITDNEEIENTLIVLRQPLSTATDAVVKKSENEATLFDFVGLKPTEFIAAVEDSNLKLKAKIEKYIMAGILKRHENTNIVVDAEEPTIIIGNNTDEHLTFFTNIANKDIIEEYNALYKSK